MHYINNECVNQTVGTKKCFLKTGARSNKKIKKKNKFEDFFIKNTIRFIVNVLFFNSHYPLNINNIIMKN